MVDSIVKEVQIKFQVLGRIGRKSEIPRPVRIKLVDVEDRRRVLSRARNLKKEEGMERLYIVPDLTKVQQEEDKRLRNEVKRLREAGETNVKIVKGVVVVGERMNN